MLQAGWNLFGMSAPTENATANAMAVADCARWIHGVISYQREKSNTGGKNDENRRNYDETMMKNVSLQDLPTTQTRKHDRNPWHLEPSDFSINSSAGAQCILCVCSFCMIQNHIWGSDLSSTAGMKPSQLRIEIKHHWIKWKLDCPTRLEISNKRVELGYNWPSGTSSKSENAPN